MANIRKTFNFRNGVQVDEDNFIVDPLGKVGIGTTVPDEFLDVRGDVKVVGIITSQSIETDNVNVAGVTTFSGITNVGIGITMYPASGIVSATKLYGDASTLSNLPTSQWINVAGAGLTSIYNQGFVGVCTNNPKFTFQVGGNDNLGSFANGVGINSSGGIVATGVVTATKFVGDVVGTVSGGITGDITGNVNATSVGSTSLTVTGVSTFAGGVNFDNASDAGKDVEWQPTNDRLSFMDDVKATFGDGADLGVYHTGVGNTSYIDNSGSGKLFIRNGTSNDIHIEAQNDKSSIICRNDGKVKIYYDGVEKVATGIEGITVVGVASAAQFTGDVHAGIVTATSRLEVAKQGIGTASPQSQLHVFTHSGISSIQVESGSSEAIISLGKFVNKKQTSAEIVFGKISGGLNYSNPASLDIINYDNGNVNNIIDLGSAAGTNAVRGNWNWMSGADINNPRMTLTHEGNLGIGKTNPARALDVVGIATISNDLFVGSNSWVKGNLNVIGNINVDGVATIDISGQNLDVTTGHSRVKNIDVTGNATVTGISSFNNTVSIAGTFGSGYWFWVNGDGQVAIQTNTFSHQEFVGLDARHTQVVAKGIGVGKTAITAAVDFSNAGRAFDNVVIEPTQANRMYMYPPKVTGTERGNLQGLTGGAIVYNTDNNSLQVYNGSSWSNQAAGGVTTLNGLSDVTISGSPSTGQFLKYTGSGWENATGTVGTLNDLTGVTISSPSNNQVLKYNGSAWVNDTSPGGLADVVSDTTPQLGGNLDTNTKNITFGDSSGATVNRLTFGTVPDMSIFHDTSNSIIRESGTGGLYLQSENNVFISKESGNANDIIADFNAQGAVSLYFNTASAGSASKKFETTSTGVSISGNITATGNGVLKSRSTVAGTASNLASGASADVDITGAFKTYALLKVAINRPAWVVLYTNDTTRTADDSRNSSTDPTPGSGVIAEVITTTAGASTFVMTPGVIGWNDDGTPATTIYAKVQNLDSVSRSITVTLTLLPLEV